jgi:hypothetical protein
LFILFSVGTSILLLPLFLWRFVRYIRTSNSATERIHEAALFTVFLGANFWHIYLHQRDGLPFTPPAVYEILRSGPKALARNFYEMLIFRPWLGEGLTTLLEESTAFYYVNIALRVIIGFFLFGWLLKNIKKPSAQGLSLLILGFSIWPLLVVFARPGALGVFLSGNYWNSRYAFPTGVVGPFFWLAICKPQRLFQGKLPTIGTLFLCLGLYWGTTQSRIPSFRTMWPALEYRWVSWSHKLAAELASPCPVPLIVQIYPPPCILTFTPGPERNHCN